MGAKETLSSINDDVMSLHSWIHPDDGLVDYVKIHAKAVAEEYAQSEVRRFYELLIKNRARFWPDDSAGEQVVQTRNDDYSISDSADLEALLERIGFSERGGV